MTSEDASPKQNKPAKSPFSAAQLKHFRELLIERRAKILESVTALEKEALKSAGQDFSVDHMADHGSDNFEQDLSLSLVEGERKELDEIGGALERLEGGGFGIREGPREPIGRERLEAIPYTRYTIEHQRKIEAGEVDIEE